MAQARQLLELGDELAVTFLGIGKLPTAPLAGDDEGVLGDIDSEVA
jgi:hypothetical protein